jgi:AcrR family transcriptional regulator
MPKLWNETIQAHRREVRDAILHTAAALVAERGLHAVTMSQIAEATGIGRATLYKYFPDVEAILVAWHDRQVAGHLEQLAEVRDRAGDAGQRLEAVLEAYALMTYERPHGTELAALVHRGEHVARARQQLSLRATASTPSQQPAACRPRPRSAGSSRSLWLGCAPRADSF